MLFRSLPISSSVTKIVDVFFAGLVLVGLMFYYGYIPKLEGIVIIPLLFFIAFMTATGCGLILASINVKYRDVRYVLPYFIQGLLFLTPVIYPTSATGKYEWLVKLNPLAPVIDAARAGLLGTGSIDYASLGVSFLIGFILLVLGVYFFKKMERFFADIV